ncbi:hypothetical protein J437_LFUL014298 [Ladona fulva]|uniref:Zinc finger PHD-type domain-containing protein n=1 Tax=Ladona fulva TaxID=123851 RepID=A0A8K0P6G4_LADFU|nr:hypothetical protein J437_LFUL014298 [Ladona fulva]
MAICKKCKQTLPKDGQYITCSGSEESLHFSCAGVAEATWRNKSLKKKEEWRCIECRNSGSTSTKSCETGDILSALKTLSQDVRDLKNSVTYISNSNDDFQKNIEYNNKMISELMVAVNELRNEIQKKDQIIDNLNMRVNSLEQQQLTKNIEICGIVNESTVNDLKGAVVSLIKSINIRVASGGIFGGLPCFPYAYSGLQVNTAFSPFLIVATPMSHALITLPTQKTQQSISKTTVFSIECTTSSASRILSNTFTSITNSFFLKPCTETELTAIISKLSSKQGAGSDEIPGKILFPSYNININIIKFPLLFLINESLKQGIFPSSLKMSRIVPIYKNKGSVNDLKNYRPIAIQNVPAKVFEKIYYRQLMSFLKKENLITACQHGFRQGKIHCISSLLRY